jgi:hypothetical protein
MSGPVFGSIVNFLGTVQEQRLTKTLPSFPEKSPEEGNEAFLSKGKSKGGRALTVRFARNVRRSHESTADLSVRSAWQMVPRESFGLVPNHQGGPV